MSIAPIQSPKTSFDNGDREPCDTPAPRQREFDFAGGAYAHATLPHGLIAASSARATLAADWTAVERKVGDIKRDLQTPAMRELFAKTGKATWTMQKIELKLAAAVTIVAVLKDKGIGSLLSVPGALASLATVADDVSNLPQQIRDALGAAHAAHPDALQLERDLRDLTGALNTLATDAKRLAGF